MKIRNIDNVFTKMLWMLLGIYVQLCIRMHIFNIK